MRGFSFFNVITKYSAQCNMNQVYASTVIGLGLRIGDPDFPVGTMLV